SLPYDAKSSQVTEDKLTDLQGVEDMKPSTETTVRLVLLTGDYVVFCNQPGHYKMGHGAAVPRHAMTAPGTNGADMRRKS
ncbi:MAG: hypothetical protein ACREFQ_09495, partial [Stellaceae bacterium]